MNRVYKVIWSKAKNCYVVASELAKNHTKSPKSRIMSRTLVAGVLACVLSCSFSVSSFAAIEMSDEEYRSFHNSGQEVYLTNLQGGTYTSLSVVHFVDGTFGFSGDTANGKHYFLTENEYKSALGVSSIPFFNSPYVSVNSSLSNVGTDGPSATGFNSIAIGSGATVTADNSVALGANSVAGLEDTVSVGSTTSQRRIVNVADGLGEHDAVTVGQLATALDNYAGINFTAGDGLHLDTNAVLDIKGGTNVTVNNNGVSVIGSGTVSNGNTGLISGNTLYNEVRIPNNGTYIKSNSTIADNLYRLDYAVSNAGVKYFGVNSPSQTSMNYEGGGAMGYDSIAIGDAKSAGSASIGIGAGTLVTGQNSIAIGTNAMASGDGMSREAVDSILSNNRNIREGLDTARSAYTASQNAYNLQLEKFNGQNEAVARVNAANALIAGYQNEINSTLQPNADTANDAYNTAKADYDDLSNRLAQQLEVVKYIDFTQYQQPGSDTIDTNAVAADIKAQAEAGTDFNYPQEMYKAYVDSYIESEGNGRQTFLIGSKMNPSTSYESNNTIERISLRTHRDNIVDVLLQTGLATDADKIRIIGELPIQYYSTARVNVNTGELISLSGNMGFIVWAPYQAWKPLWITNGTENYLAYAKTVTLNDEAYQQKVNYVNSAFDSQISTVTDKFNALKATGVFTPEEVASMENNIINVTDYENTRRAVILDLLNYAHEGYLYDNAKSKYGENASVTLQHLSNQSASKKRIIDILGTAQGEKLFLAGNNDSIYYRGYDLFGINQEATNERRSYKYVSGMGNFFDFVNGVNGSGGISARIWNWYKENIVDHQNLVKYTLNQLQGSMNDFLADKRTAYEEATAAKTAADNALNAKRQQIAQATPSQADIDAANAAQASATELQQKADKLEADRTALETAKAALDELQSIEEAGKGAIAIGDTAITTGEDAIGMGTNVIVTGENAVAVGKGSIVSGDRAVALGTNNSISKEQSIAIGTNNGITGENSIAIGNNNVISGNNSIAIGNSLNVTDDNVVSIGNRRMTNIAAGTADTDAVNLKQLNDAIQDFEIDTDGVVEQGNTGLISGGTVFNESRISSDGRYVRSANTVAQNLNAIDAIMVGYDSVAYDTLTFNGTNGTKLTNLKQAVLSATSTDAVTGAQLFATNQNIAGFAADINRNKESIREMNTSVSAALDSVSSTSLLVDTIDNLKADASLNNLTAAGQQVIATAAANAVQEYMASQSATNSTNNVTPPASPKLMASGGMRLMSVNPAPADTNYVVYDDTSADTITLEGQPGTGTKITNLADGELAAASTDAVTGSQLYTVTQQFDEFQSALSKNNTSIARAQTDINNIKTTNLGLQSDVNTLKTQMEAGINVTVDGASVKNITPESNYVNFVTGDNIALSNDNGSLKISAKSDGAVINGNTGLVSGGTVYNAIQDALAGYGGEAGTALAGKANADASNIGKNADTDNSSAWGQALGTGTVTQNDDRLVTGKTMYDELRAGDGNYVKSDKTTGQNLQALDTAVGEIQDTVTGIQDTVTGIQDNITGIQDDITGMKDDITGIRSDLDGKADKDLSNLSDSAKGVIRNIAQNSTDITSSDGSLTTTITADNGKIVYDLSVVKNGKVEEGNTGILTGDTVYQAIKDINPYGDNVITGQDSGAVGKRNTVAGNGSYTVGNDNTVTEGSDDMFVLGSNVNATGHNSVVLGKDSDGSQDNVVSVGAEGKERRIVHVADGTIAKNSKDAVNGGQIYDVRQELREAKEINTDEWAKKLGIGEVAEGDGNLVTGDTVYNAIQKLDTTNGAIVPDADTGEIRIGGTSRYDSFDTVNIAKADGTARVLRGVATDPNDPSSAANVGYVNAIGQNIVNGVNEGFTRVNDRMDKVGAGAAAMAGLVPGPMDGDERWSLSAAVGNYRSATAGAIGAFYKPAENVVLAVKGAFGNGENMVSGGIGVTLNKGNVPGVTKAQLVRTVNAQAQKIQTMEEQNRMEREQDRAKIAQLEATLQQVLEAQQKVNE